MYEYEPAIGAKSIETMLWHIQREIMQRQGCDAAVRMISPLHWYVYSGRASTEFLRKLMRTKPFLVARGLIKGGSDEETINRICKRIGFERC